MKVSTCKVTDNKVRRDPPLGEKSGMRHHSWRSTETI